MGAGLVQLQQFDRSDLLQAAVHTHTSGPGCGLAQRPAAVL
jgi:BioD-like phosphotransacetylase family protein